MFNLNHEIGLKPRESKELPAEKLLDILKGIYPEDLALELFHKIQGNDGGADV